MAWAGVLVIAHVVLSLGLLPGGYFVRFISEGHVSVAGGISLLTGGLAIGLLELGARGAALWRAGATTASISGLLALSALHTAALGLSSWFDLSTWPGGLPPLTLIASAPAFVVGTILVRSYWRSARRDKLGRT